MINKETLYKIINICSSQEEVRREVLKNHDNNLWWPLDIEDYRKRLLIAGLSTRISYNMINKYREVIFNLDQYEYEELKNMDEEEIKSIIKKLGLSNTRHKYIKTMMDYIEKRGDEILTLDQETLIKEINENVNGASYKVAQCCVLYINDYHCNIMPVDSGMKDMFLPCIGFNIKKGAIGHEIARKELTELCAGLDLKSLAIQNGYGELSFPEDGNLSWWAHLSLIYYKRAFCNKHKPEECPINNAKVLCKESCRRNYDNN